MTTAAPTAKKQEGMIRSMNIPKEVRAMLRSEAKRRGISVSSLTRAIIDEYIDGTLVVPTTPGPQMVSTSMWVPKETWAQFIAKSEANEHSTQWILRSWLDRERYHRL